MSNVSSDTKELKKYDIIIVCLIGGNNNVWERQLISQFLSTYTPQEQAESHKKK